MRHCSRRMLSILLTMASCSTVLPAFAAGFHAGIIRPAASARSSASRMSAKANANANTAAGNPYVNPNVAAGHRTTQDNASANEDAAEIRSAHQSVTAP